MLAEATTDAISFDWFSAPLFPSAPHNLTYFTYLLLRISQDDKLPDTDFFSPAPSILQAWQRFGAIIFVLVPNIYHKHGSSHSLFLTLTHTTTIIKVKTTIRRQTRTCCVVVIQVPIYNLTSTPHLSSPTAINVPKISVPPMTFPSLFDRKRFLPSPASGLAPASWFMPFAQLTAGVAAIIQPPAPTCIPFHPVIRRSNPSEIPFKSCKGTISYRHLLLSNIVIAESN